MTTNISPKVSIIVPIYNTEKYLPKCLDSLIEQTLSDIEIICVNDGSTDHSLTILEQYKQKDPRIIVLNQNNSGQSIARNQGLKMAQGKYIQLVDADDWITNDCCQILYQQAEDDQLDMLTMAATSYIENKKEYIKEPFYNFYWLENKNERLILTRKEYMQHWWEFAPTAPLTLYNRNFLIKNKLFFPEHLKFEDCLFFKQALFKTDKIGINRSQLYFHRGHMESTVNNGGYHYLDWFTINAQIYNLIKSYEISQKQIDTWLFSTVNYSFKLWKGINKQFRQQFYKKAHDFYTRYSPSTDWIINNKTLRRFLYSLLIAKNYLTFKLLYYFPKKTSKKNVSIKILGFKLKYPRKTKCSS